MLNIDYAFAEALKEHQGGNLRHAEQRYQLILDAGPNHGGSHHVFGVVAYQTGRYGPAIASIPQALALKHLRALYHYHFAVAQEVVGQMEEAASIDRPFMRRRT
jgi:tetratricopeptide (TPR) repeat protein